MDRHFNCTACGKCCQGWLPLTIADALYHAERFPLFIMWSPVRPGGKSYARIEELGITLDLKKKKHVAVRITPFSYVPHGVNCPALLPDGLCAVHDTKPQRCRTMPLSAARAEDDQADLLIPKAGWTCDISDNAPIVYRDKNIVERTEYEAELKALKADAPTLKAYGQFLLAANPKVRMDVEKMATNPRGGHVVVNFSTLTPRLPQVDMFAFARHQLPIMETFAKRTQAIAELEKDHKRYQACADEYRRMLNQE